MSRRLTVGGAEDALVPTAGQLSLPQMKIGVLSDTHDHLDPKIPALFDGVDHILHAGDIGLPWLILQLESIAPVTAVLVSTPAISACLG